MFAWIALLVGVVMTLVLSLVSGRIIEATLRPEPKTGREPGRFGKSSILEALIVAAIVLIVAAVAIPNLLRARIAANEASALASMRAMNTAILTYKSTYGTYPESLEVLGPPPRGVPPSREAAGLLDKPLAGGHELGFSFKYLPEREQIVARPLVGPGELRLAVADTAPVKP